jgi:hypothetical protein
VFDRGCSYVTSVAGIACFANARELCFIFVIVALSAMIAWVRVTRMANNS